MAIFLLLGQGKYAEKTFGEWVIWSIAPKSMIQELAKVVSETFNPIEDENSPEYASEQVLEGLSRLPMRDLTLSTSLWLRPPIFFGVALYCYTTVT